ncbi:MAG: hypothetical protein U0M00_02940 [Clostridia bacterium]|nr:hypothetical protein [Clostridia bacterium]
MLSYKNKLMVSTIIAILFISIFGMIYTVNGANENIQIVKKSGNKYLIYISGHMNLQFEFAFSNDQGANKETLGYKSSILDSTSEENNVAYIDNSLYSAYFSGKTYLWARDLSGKYFAEGVEIDLSKAIEESNVNLINNLTKIIKVDTKNTITTSEVVNEVKVTKTVGKVDVLEEGTTYYQLVKLPASEEHNEFMKTAEKIANDKIENNMYAKLEVANKFSNYYNKLVPNVDDAKWIKVNNNTILQPEESHDGEQYILWLKTEKNGENKIDVQFLTCFEDYKPEVISEKITTKLPVTYDNPILFIILAVLVVALVVVLILRNKTEKIKTEKH